MKWEEIQADEVKAGDYIDVNGQLTEIVEVKPQGIAVEHDGRWLVVGPLVQGLGVKFKRKVEEHPHGIIPATIGSVVRVRSAVYERHPLAWYRVGLVNGYSDEEIQTLADAHDFDVLWPRPAVEITDEMSERAGRALWESYRDPLSPDKERWVQQPESVKNDAIMRATLALEAALGGEQ